jgi:hypothetical protein
MCVARRGQCKGVYRSPRGSRGLFGYIGLGEQLRAKGVHEARLLHRAPAHTRMLARVTARVSAPTAARCRAVSVQNVANFRFSVRSPGADVAGVSPAPVQMRKGRAHSRCRSGRGEPSPGADVAGVSPVPVQMWAPFIGPCALGELLHLRVVRTHLNQSAAVALRQHSAATTILFRQQAQPYTNLQTHTCTNAHTHTPFRSHTHTRTPASPALCLSHRADAGSFHPSERTLREGCTTGTQRVRPASPT